MEGKQGSPVSFDVLQETYEFLLGTGRLYATLFVQEWATSSMVSGAIIQVTPWDEQQKATVVVQNAVAIGDPVGGEQEYQVTGERQYTVDELGELIACAGCERPTYDARLLKGTGKLPPGFTVGNKRMTVRVHGVLLVVCQNCRYDLYGRF